MKSYTSESQTPLKILIVIREKFILRVQTLLTYQHIIKTTSEKVTNEERNKKVRPSKK